jgi:hypothetical protein
LLLIGVSAKKHTLAFTGFSVFSTVVELAEVTRRE